MRRISFSLAGLILGCLVLGGCDKCGDPVKFNVPNACYDAPRGK